MNLAQGTKLLKQAKNYLEKAVELIEKATAGMSKKEKEETLAAMGIPKNAILSIFK